MAVQMTTPAARITVLVGERFACIKISGRATFNSSIDFKTLLTELMQRNYRYFILELAECALMDSTFLGVLAGFGLKMKKQPGGAPIELLNANERIVDLLEGLGVLDLFEVKAEGAQLPGKCQEIAHQPGEHSRIEQTEACIEAHETLMALSPANAARFKDVSQFLNEDLKRLKAAES